MDFLIEYYSEFLLNHQISYSMGFFLWYAAEFVLIALIMLFSTGLFTLIEQGLLSALYGDKICCFRASINLLAKSINIFFKEVIISDKSDKLLYITTPVLYLIPCVLMWCIIPMGTTSVPIKSDTGILLFIFAVISASIFKILIKLSKNNKYGTISAVEELIQTTSFLIPLLTSVISIVILSGTMSMQNIVINQYNQGLISWYCFPSFIGFCVCLTILIFLKSNKTENDFSGIQYGIIKFGEKEEIIALCMFITVIFLGGYMPPVQIFAANFFENSDILYSMCLTIEQFIHLMLKTIILYITIIIIKSKLPTLKKENCIELSWKYLVPLSIINILVVCLIKHGGFYG